MKDTFFAQFDAMKSLAYLKFKLNESLKILPSKHVIVLTWNLGADKGVLFKTIGQSIYY